MKYGKVLVEQVLTDGAIVDGYDTSLSPSEIATVLCEHFPGLSKATSTFFVGEHKGHRYAIRCKNVTYLGNPHPTFKKRIQISDDLESYYKAANEIGATPLLMGIYTNEDNTLFVDFKIDTYIEKKAHNSSAHIYSDDLAEAAAEGYFQKKDFFGNTVTAFKPEVVEIFLDELFGIIQEEEVSLEENIENAIKEPELLVFDHGGEIPLDFHVERKDETVSGTKNYFKKVIVPEFRNFFESINKKWNGIDCYKEMIEDNYKNKFQPEWVGFYLEYCFGKYIRDNHLENTVTYYQNKKDGGIDLDLYFPHTNTYGDLKAHSENSSGIQGNDWKTIFSILDRNDETSHVYYIVCEHATEKDSEYGYQVTQFWNRVQKKPDLLSYHKRMKNNVVLKKIYLLDINNSNKEYLTMFKQGINSNGKPRAPKIMIEHDKIKEFVVDEIIL